MKVKSPRIKVYRNPFHCFQHFCCPATLCVSFYHVFFYTLGKKRKLSSLFFLFIFFFFTFLFLLLFLHSSSNKFPCSKDAGQFFFIKIRHSEIFFTKEIKFVHSKDCHESLVTNLTNSLDLVKLNFNENLYLV